MVYGSIFDKFLVICGRILTDCLYIIQGEGDMPAIMSGTEYMAAKIPGAKLVKIKNAKHAANIQQPEAFNGRLHQHLAAEMYGSHLTECGYHVVCRGDSGFLERERPAGGSRCEALTRGRTGQHSAWV